MTPRPAPPDLRNIQIRVDPMLHETLKDVAQRKGMSIADSIREALQLYLISIAYADEGKQLMWEDPKTGMKTEVLIPGITGSVRFTRQRLAQADAADESGSR